MTATEEPIANTAGPRVHPFRALWAVRDFKLLAGGQLTSLLGDQFYMIALPWLVLQVTHDPLALGTVLALAGVPRAALMLVGGAVSDRWSPRAIMLVSDWLRLGLCALLAALVAAGRLDVWMLYAFAGAFGLISGFFMPASNAILPQILAGSELQAGNSLVEGAASLTVLVGPPLAGALIALFQGSGPLAERQAAERAGVALAFAIDGATFLVSVLTLWALRSGRARAAAGTGETGLLAAIGAGLRYVWGSPALRLLLIIATILNFLLVGPLLVGLPVLAQTRFPEGAIAFGVLMGCLAGGNLAGTLLAGLLPRASARAVSTVLVVTIFAFGAGTVAIGFVTLTPVAALLLVLMGVGNGYLSILLLTRLQRGTPPELLGRVMSLMLFSNVGLVPVSQALSGAISAVSPTALFVTAGALILLTGVVMPFLPELHAIGQMME